MSLFDLVDSMPALGFISLIIAIIALIRSSQLESRLRELEDTLKRSGPERPQLKTRMGQTQPETTELAATATAPPSPLPSAPLDSRAPEAAPQAPVPPPTAEASEPTTDDRAPDTADEGEDSEPAPDTIDGFEDNEPAPDSVDELEDGERAPEPPASSQPNDDEGPSTAAPTPAAHESVPAGWERALGLRGLTWAGIAILFLSFSLFLKYAYDQDWLGRVFTPPVRLASISLLGAGLLGAGWRALRGSMTALGQGLLGGGLATLYLCIFAALKPSLLVVPEPLLSPTVAFGLMLLVVVGGLAMALRWNMQGISIIALIGGLATPVLTSSGDGSQHALFAYLLLLDLGVLAAAWYRSWRWLDTIAFAGTVILFGAWYHQGYPAAGAPWSTMPWLLMLGSVFLVVPFVGHWRAGTRVTGERFAMALGSSAFITGYGALMLSADHALPLGLLDMLLAAGLMVLRRITVARCGADARVEHGFVVVTATLMALAALALLPGDAVALAWTLEAVTLIVLGYRFRCSSSRHLAIPLLGLAFVRMVWLTPWPSDAAFLLHAAAMQMLALVAATIGGAWVHHHFRARRSMIDTVLMNLLAIGGGVLLCFTLQGDWLRAGDAWIGTSPWTGDGLQIGALPLWPALLAWIYAVLGKRWDWRIGQAAAYAASAYAALIGLAAMLWLGNDNPLMHPAIVSALAGLAAIAWLWRQLSDGPYRIVVGIALAFVAATLLGTDLSIGLHPDGAPPLIHGAWFAFPFVAAAAALALWSRRLGTDAALDTAAGLTWCIAALAAVLAYAPPFAYDLPIMNPRAVALLGAIAVAVWCGKHRRRASAAGAATLGLILVTLEIPLHLYHSGSAASTASSAVTMGWLAYAATLLACGFWCRMRALRFAALALFALTAAKLLLIDMANADTLIRIVSFLITGLVLIAASWAYHRLEKHLDESGLD